MTKEDQLLLATIDDKMERCDAQYIETHTNFLDTHQVSLVNSYFKSLKGQHFLYGGYDDAERCIAVFLPDYLTAESFIASEDNPLSVLSIRLAKGSRSLSHRDYLGSALALGIKREVIGDIIVFEGGADMIILKDMEEFFLTNYSKAGRTNLNISIKSISELSLGEINIKHTRDTIASLRLDNVVSSAFNLSRGKAQDAIRAGLVFHNSIETTKPDILVDEGDKIVLRGKGKARLTEIGGKSRKDRICVEYDIYI